MGIAKGLQKSLISNPSDLKLYHGTTGIDGERIEIKSNSGVGWNAYTLGDGFYTSKSIDASRLFAHLSHVKMRLNCDESLWPSLDPKIYQIKLKNSIRLLDAEISLDASSVRDVLERAGVSKRYLNFCSAERLSDFKEATSLLCGGLDWEGNRNEYLTRSLGYDGLLIMEDAWDTWDYYPDGIGVDWDSCLKGWNDAPPKTLVIYNTDGISSFVELDQSRLIAEEPTR